MKCQFRQNSKSGFTLIELLVVMLILVILGIAALPAIRQNMVRARYAADAVPMISDIRTKIELYRYEHDHLPGVTYSTGHKSAGKFGISLMTDVKEGEGADATTTQVPGAYIQTMLYSEENNASTLTYSGKPAFVADTWGGNSDLSEDMSSGDGVASMVAWAGTKYHLLNEIDVNYEGLRGRFVNPFNLQYIPLYNRGSDYCHVVAVVGNGGGLPVGTGYAVLEYNNTALKVKFLATFERYQPVNGSQRPLNLAAAICAGIHADEVSSNFNILIDGEAGTNLQDSFEKGLEDDGTGTYNTTEGLKAMNDFRSALEDAGWKID